MRVRIAIGIAGERFSHDPGDIVDVDEATARGWLQSGVAVMPDEPEVATMIAGPEQPTHLRARRRRSR